MTQKIRMANFGFQELAVLALLASSVVAAQAPPTPTPRPKLSGGFGRPRATPAAVSAGGQSLADVVRAAHDAKEQSPERGSVTINNRSLVTNPEKGRVSTSRIAPPRSPSPAPHSPTADGAPAAPSPISGAGPTGSSETEWRETAQRARKRVADARAHLEELQAAATKLESDFYAWDDGQYRDRVIKPAWDRTLRELEDTRRELAEAEKDLNDLPEKARRAGALPGWIRE
jgi:hypothetical protein